MCFPPSVRVHLHGDQCSKCVQYGGGLLRDIILLVLCDYMGDVEPF